jgi:hypothetical protein
MREKIVKGKQGIGTVCKRGNWTAGKWNQDQDKRN